MGLSVGLLSAWNCSAISFHIVMGSIEMDGAVSDGMREAENLFKVVNLFRVKGTGRRD